LIQAGCGKGVKIKDEREYNVDRYVRKFLCEIETPENKKVD